MGKMNLQKSGKIVKQSALKTANIVTHLVTGVGPIDYVIDIN